MATFSQENLDPLSTAASTVLDLSMIIMDPIIMPGSGGELLPGVAESWEVDESQEFVTFYIREGIEFHNGEQLTAEDVVFTLQAWFDEDVAISQSGAGWTFLVAGPDDIEMVDDYTVVVRTALAPAERLPQAIVPIESGGGLVLPKNYIEEIGWEAWRAEPYVGSGPWEFVSHSSGDEFVFRARQEHAFRPPPAFEELVLLHVPEEATRVSMILNNEADIAPIEAAGIDQLEAADGVRVDSFPGAVNSAINLSGTWLDDVGPTGDVRVRQALSLAIDRQAIIDTILGGRGAPIPGSFFSTHFDRVEGLDPESWGVDMTLYDPDRAAELLQDAGYADGFTLDMYAYQQTGSPPGAQLAEIFAGYWHEIGVETNIIQIDLGRWSEIGASQGQVSEEVYGTTNIHRRRRSLSVDEILGSFHPAEAQAEATIGPVNGGHMPDFEERLEFIRASTGDERLDAARELWLDLSELYIQPATISIDALFAIGNNAGEWNPNILLAQLGAAYETVQHS